MSPSVLSQSVPRSPDGPRSSASRRKALRALGCLVLLVLPFCMSNTQATETQVITRVEEDWVLELGVPDPGTTAPQIINSISPTNSLSDIHAVFELNHSTQPSYTDGGMQVQAWLGDTNLTYNDHPNNNILATPDEVIRYTVCMQLAGTLLTFEILNGNSTTWGTFGGQGYLKSNVATTLTSLAGYSPDTSVANSAIGFASHRVKCFRLHQVRYYSINGLVATDNTVRVVHGFYDPYAGF